MATPRTWDEDIADGLCVALDSILDALNDVGDMVASWL